MNLNDDADEQQGYKWEVAYAEGLNLGELKEDEQGSIEKSVRQIITEAKRLRRTVDRPAKVKLGIMRYLSVVIDYTSAMLGQSLYPTRFQVTLTMISSFLDKFFEQNPISQLTVILCKDKRAERLVPFTSNVTLIKEALANLSDACCSGEFSLQSSLELAASGMKDMPGHASKEILIIMASLATVDASNVFTTFEVLKRSNVRCSVIGLSGELFVCKKLCSTTGGRYAVVLDESHFDILVSDHVPPPPSKKGAEYNAIRAGFPSRVTVKTPSFCACHDSMSQKNAETEDRAYFCVQCGARYCSLPIECRVCGLLLITAPQLARAHQHLTPLPAFAEIDKPSGNCYACDVTLQDKAYNCKRCEATFCIDCDLILHESLQVCPSCR